ASGCVKLLTWPPATTPQTFNLEVRPMALTVAMIHLRGWQRIGVVLSLLWVAFTVSYAAYEIHAGNPFNTNLLVEMVPAGNPTASGLVPVESRLVILR